MMWELFREQARVLADVVLGPTCLHCGGLLEGSRFRCLCGECGRRVLRVQPPCCGTCGHPLVGPSVGGVCCEHCSGLEPEFGQGRTAVLMRGPARTLVHHLKYRGGLAVLSDIGQLMREMPDLEEFLGGKVLVPVPLHPRKLRERGYNQSEEIANELARLFPCTHAMPLLKRVRDTTTQTRLDRTARLANLKNAFALTETRTLYAALRCVLVDDVFTTGSTLNACARALCGAGCQRVDVLTFGHG